MTTISKDEMVVIFDTQHRFARELNSLPKITTPGLQKLGPNVAD